MQVMESPQQPNLRPIVDVDMNRCGLRLTPGIFGQIAALPPLPVFRRYRAANRGPNVCILFKFNFMTERLLYMFSQCHLSPHCLLLHMMV